MVFKCWVGSAALRCWGRAIHTLVSAGENDIHFNITPNSVTMTSVDSSLTVVCQCKFDKTFFSRYEFQGNTDLTCRMPSKVLLKPFKSLRFLVRCSDACEIEFDPERYVMIITIPCKGGVKVRHRLQFSVETEQLDLDFDSDTLASCIAADPRLMLQSLSNFTMGKGVSDLTIKASTTKLLLKNCVNDMLKKEGKVYTELTMNSVDFRQYSIDSESELTFPMREFKSFLGFAEHMRASLTMHFKGPRDPFVVKAQNEDGLYLASLVLATATLNSDRTTRSHVRATPAAATPQREVATTSASFSGTPSRTPATKRSKPGNDLPVQPSTTVLDDDHVIVIDDPIIIPRLSSQTRTFSGSNFLDRTGTATSKQADKSCRTPRSSEYFPTPVVNDDIGDFEMPEEIPENPASQSMLHDSEHYPILDLENDQNQPPPIDCIDQGRYLQEDVGRKRMKLLFPNAGKVFDPARDIPGYNDILCEGTDEEDN